MNWTEYVSEETMTKKTHMMHAFGSLVIAQTLTFEDVPQLTREPFYQVSPDEFILTTEEWLAIKEEYVELMSRVIGENIPYFDHSKTLIKGPYSDELTKPNKIIPLPLLFKNEQSYADVVDILDFYEGMFYQRFSILNLHLLMLDI